LAAVSCLTQHDYITRLHTQFHHIRTNQQSGANVSENLAHVLNKLKRQCEMLTDLPCGASRHDLDVDKMFRGEKSSQIAFP